VQEPIARKQMENLGLKNGNRQKVIPVTELKKWVSEG
jgi:hypothetical protein